MSDPSDVVPTLMAPVRPYVIVLFGATGDLARRKLLPGLLHLSRAGLIPECRIVASSLDEMTEEEFRRFARQACEEFASRGMSEEQWEDFERTLRYVPQDGGPTALAEAVAKADAELGGEPRRLHYLSIPPAAAQSVVRTLREAGLVDRARIIMEKPFGTDLASARALNAALHETFAEEQIYRIDHFLGKEAAQNILAFRFANGLFEPIWNRNHIDHVQIDVPEVLSLDSRLAFYEKTGAYRDMVVTHLFQVLAFMAMEPPTELEPGAISEEKNKVFRSMRPVEPNHVVRGQYVGYRDEPGVAGHSETETFVALRCEIDNWRWAGVPFYLRTGKRMAEGARIISIAFREPPKSMFPPGSGRRRPRPGPPHVRPGRRLEAVALLLRQAAGAGDEARQAEPPVRAARDRSPGRGAGGLRAADPRRDERRSHALHDGRGHRAPVGDLDAAARDAPARALLPARLVGSERHPPADRAARAGACPSSGPGAPPEPPVPPAAYHPARPAPSLPLPDVTPKGKTARRVPCVPFPDTPATSKELQVATPTTMPAITHVAVTVTDLARSEAWYTNVLGAPPVLDEDTGPFRHIVYAVGGTLLGLHGFPDLATTEPFDERRPGLDHIAFGCASRSDLEDWAKRLDELGIAHGEIKDAGYGSGLSFRDPDNIALELFAPPGS